jgi:hypothetical protein
MPYLADPRSALEGHPSLAYRVSVYADQPFSLGAAEECGGDKCEYDCKNCPLYNVYERLKRMEVRALTSRASRTSRTRHARCARVTLIACGLSCMGLRRWASIGSSSTWAICAPLATLRTLRW